MRHYSDFEYDKERLEELVERRKELQSVLNFVKDDVERKEQKEKEPSKTGVWVSSSKSSFFLMDAETEVEPCIRGTLAEMEEEIRNLCMKIQRQKDKMEQEREQQQDR